MSLPGEEVVRGCKWSRPPPAPPTFQLFDSIFFVILKSDHCGRSDRISEKLSPPDNFLPETKFPED